MVNEIHSSVSPPSGPARLAIIVKEKEAAAPGQERKVKRRIIVDHKRNGGNDRARVPERPVLPRVIDAVNMFLRMMSMAIAWGWGEEHCELITGDFSDAYFHFRVYADEQKHCLTPDLLKAWVTMLMWVHMCFGLRAAPLPRCRLAAATSSTGNTQPAFNASSSK